MVGLGNCQKERDRAEKSAFELGAKVSHDRELGPGMGLAGSVRKHRAPGKTGKYLKERKRIKTRKKEKLYFGWAAW